MSEQAKRAAAIFGVQGNLSHDRERLLETIIDAEFADVMEYVEYVKSFIYDAREASGAVYSIASMPTFSEWQKEHK